MPQQIALLLQELNFLTVSLRLLLAVLCGGVIGYERGRKGRAAGLRTHMLVCLGAATAMLVNQYLFDFYGTGDPARIGAQVVSGIGFLGVGTIIITGHRQVRGLTTAAGLWASACIGLAAGCGFYEGALVATVLAYLAVKFLARVDKRVLGKLESMTFYVELEPLCRLSTLLLQLREKSCRMVDLELHGHENDPAEGLSAIITVALCPNLSRGEAETVFAAFHGIHFLEAVS
jgi:putative Mg2+ transporter-C (MgtC) family protein